MCDAENSVKNLDYDLSFIMPQRCRKHPLYRGLRQPTSGCPKCAEIYSQMEPARRDSLGLDG